MPAILLILGLILSGCGAGRDFRAARALEAEGRAAEAVRRYERFIENHPDDRRVPEAAYRAGRLHAVGFGNCEQAVPLFERAARRAASSPEDDPWPEKAKLGLMSCPDFFPLRKGAKWTMVDSASGGEYMQLKIGVDASTEGIRAQIKGAFFAGEEKDRDYDRSYLKEGWTIWETDGDSKLPILKFPYNKGRSWEASRKEGKVRFTIVKDRIKVRVKGGKFAGCLKVKSHTAGYESWVFDYYCPGVGRVKTTVGAAGVENPNTELAEYDVPEGPGVL